MVLIDRIRNINLFKNPEKTSEEDLKNQRISTFVVLLLIHLSLILLIFITVKSVTKTVAIENPSFSLYRTLEDRYPNTLVCPCRSASNAYSTFVHDLEPIYNELCSSDFVSDNWLNYVNYRSKTDAQYHYFLDFRHSAYGFFNMIKTLCQLSSVKISEQLFVFYMNMLVTENIISEETFNATIYASQNHFISTMARSFLLSLKAFRGTVQGNAIGNQLQTNHRLYTFEFAGTWYGLVTSITYDEDKCYCDYTTLCKETTGIYTRQRSDHIIAKQQLFNSTLVYSVPGVNTGCYIFDALLQSNLSCMHNISCLSDLRNNLADSPHPLVTNSIAPLRIPTFSASLPTISELVENLLVDNWFFNFSYESYFNQCNPSICSYTYIKQFDVIDTVTSTVGFLGGIISILMLLTLPAITLIRNRFKTPTVNTSQEDQNVNLKLSAKIRNLVWNLNIFEDPEEKTEWYLYNQRYSTRIYISSIIVTLSILVLFTCISYVTKTVIIKKPTLATYYQLETKYPETLICPCLSIAIEYKEFISFQPRFHQICSSDFVTDNWTRSFLLQGIVYAKDFRAVGPNFFSTLAAFCVLSLEIINNALFTFNSTKYVTRNVQQLDLFQSRIEQIIDLQKRSITNSFQQLLSMSRQTFTSNALFSTLLSNYGYATVTDNSSDALSQVFFPYIYILNDNDSSTSCSCKISPSTCNKFTAFYKRSGYDYAPEYIIPGILNGCFLIEALFQSTFECFFDQQCLNDIINFTSSTAIYPFVPTIMKYNSTNTKYKTTTIILDIVENLMIEQWNNRTSFQSYFEQCSPQSCTYTYKKQADLGYIFTITIGMISGLTTLFRTLIPPIVAYVRRKKKPLTPTVNEPSQPSGSIIRRMFISLKNIILTLNLFKSKSKRSNEQRHRQRIATRIFIILLFCSLTSLLLFVSLDNNIHSKTIQNPTMDQYSAFLQQYSDSVQCPCTTISVEYQDFIWFQPHFHTICSSAFVNTTSPWLSIDYPASMFAAKGRPKFRTKVDDFRYIASLFFQFINSACQLSLQTISVSLVTFNSTKLITPNLISPEQFQHQIDQLVSGFIGNAARSFLNALLLVHNMTRANMLVSAVSSDSILTLYPDYQYVYSEDYASGYEYVYNRMDQFYNSTLTGIECDCQYSYWCKQQAIVYGVDAKTVLFVIPGIFVGCYVVEAVLQSDLRCFYNFNCLQEFSHALNISATDSNALSLDSTRYQVDTSMLEIVSNLMLEDWNHNISYSMYFNRCQPKSCTATFIGRGNIVYIITTTIALIGGLAKLYQFIIPLVVGGIFKTILPFIRKKLNRTNVTPVTQIDFPAGISV